MNYKRLTLLSGGPLQPKALFSFASAQLGINLVTGSKIATSSNVTQTPGADGIEDGSLEFTGSQNSFIEIANGPRGELDTQHSMTILALVYPTGNAGPILSYDEYGVQLCQEYGYDGGKGDLVVSFNRRDLAQVPEVRSAVLNLNQWNYVGASYDYETGHATLWHDGKEVQTEFIGAKMQLATQFPVRIGSLNVEGFAFSGRIASLQIFPQALSVEQVIAAAEMKTGAVTL